MDFITDRDIRAEKRGKKVTAHAYGLIAFLSIGSLVCGLLLYCMSVLAVDAYYWIFSLKPTTNRYHFIALSAVLVFLLGSMFFWVRLKWRFIYGLAEALVGIAFAVHRLTLETNIELPADPAFYFAMLTAGVYLVVRGLDNMHKGWNERRDPVVRLISYLGTEQVDEAPSPPRRLRHIDALAKKQKQNAMRYRIVESRPEM